MRLKKYNIEKELKKVQKKGIYNPKLKIGIILFIILLGSVIGISFAFYTKINKGLIITGTISKKINIKITASHGTINGKSSSNIQTDYGEKASVKVIPESGYKDAKPTCTESNKVITTYDVNSNSLTITPNTIKDITCTITFVEKEKTFAETIIANNEVIDETPNFKIGEPPADGSKTTGSGLYKWEEGDDSGSPVYYFRGAINNNYIKFANKMWRIVRINGDGSIRLILNEKIGTYDLFNEWPQEGKYEENVVGYTIRNSSACTTNDPCISDYQGGVFTNSKNGTNSKMKTYLEDWYKDNLVYVNDKIELGRYCNDTTYTTDTIESGLKHYNALNREENGTPSLKCPNTSETYGGSYKIKIGLLSLDEMIMGGLSSSDLEATSGNYLYKDSRWWSMSPMYTSYLHEDHMIYCGYKGSISGNSYLTTVYPVINLKANIIYSRGNGEYSSPYEVK